MATAIAGAFGLGRQGVEYHHIPDPLPVQDRHIRYYRSH